MLQLDLQLKELKEVLKRKKEKRFLIELPEGLKHKYLHILHSLKDTKKEFVLSIDTTFGACDIYETDLKKANCEAIIHFGHTKFINTKEKIIYWPCYYIFDKEDIEKTIKDIEKKFAKKKITIVGPIQYNNFIFEIVKELKKHKKLDVVLGKENNKLKIGQILGCDCSNVEKISKKLDAIIYLGDGNFHFNALQSVKAYKYDFNNNFEEINSKKIINYDALFLQSKVIGIYVSSKLGQNKIKIAEDLVKKINKINKEAIIIYGNEINENKLIGLGINFLINTACPRITDDHRNYYLPVINFTNLLKIYKKYF